MCEYVRLKRENCAHYLCGHAKTLLITRRIEPFPVDVVPCVPYLWMGLGRWVRSFDLPIQSCEKLGYILCFGCLFRNGGFISGTEGFEVQAFQTARLQDSVLDLSPEVVKIRAPRKVWDRLVQTCDLVL